MGCLYGWEKETGKLISVFILLKMVFFAAQQHFFDNSKSCSTAKRRLVRLRKGFTGGPAFGLIYRKNLEFALRTPFYKFS
jgi:hypothetical protein